MEKTKTLALEKDQLINLVYLGVLSAAAIFAPLLKFQAVSGSIVNAILFISVILLGLRGAVLVALIPSLAALSIGLLPPVLAPMVPFIMMGNIISISVFDYLRNKSYWLGVFWAGFLKFMFLFFSSSIVINLIIKKEIASTVAAMMSWPQLFTALAGGIIAYFFLKKFKKIS